MFGRTSGELRAEQDWIETTKPLRQSRLRRFGAFLGLGRWWFRFRGGVLGLR